MFVACGCGCVGCMRGLYGGLIPVWILASTIDLNDVFFLPSPCRKEVSLGPIVGVGGMVPVLE